MNNQEMRKEMIEKMEKMDVLKEEFVKLQKALDSFELDVDSYEDQYCDMLNEEGAISVAGLTFDPAYIVRELDPTAYRCGLIDYVDGIDVSDDPKYKDLEEKIENLENEIDDLEAEIEELEREREREREEEEEEREELTTTAHYAHQE